MNPPDTLTNRRLEDFAGSSADWFWETDADHRVVFTSDQLFASTGVKEKSVIGRRRDEIANADLQDPNWRAHLADLAAHRPFRDFEYTMTRASDGNQLWLRIGGRPFFSETGVFLGYRGTACETTKRRETIDRLVATNAKLAQRNQQLVDARKELEHAAHHDALTGSLNRYAFERDLDALFAAPPKPIAILHLDVDRLKWVNDSLGQITGDKVLMEVSDRIRNVVAESGRVYRVGGDEFKVLLTKNITPELATWIGDGIVETMGRPIQYDLKTAKVGMSIGVALGQSKESDVPELIAQAEAALYEAKQDGRNVMRQLTPELKAKMQTRRRIAADLPRALEKGEIIPFFQPQINVTTGAVVGAEALVRWQHPELGLLAPAAFLDIATELGLSATLDRHMLREAMRAEARLRSAGHDLPSISVNVSAARLLDPRLGDDIEEFWQDNRCRLCVELLETIYLDEAHSSNVVAENLTRMRALGVHIETDDFGSGRASMSALLSVQPHRLKIDRTLVHAAAKDAMPRSLVSAILEMTRAIGIECIAEGVETEAEVNTIRALGCEIFQGYAFAKPLSEADLTVYLAKRPCPAQLLGSKTKTAGPKGLPRTA